MRSLLYCRGRARLRSRTSGAARSVSINCSKNKRTQLNSARALSSCSTTGAGCAPAAPTPPSRRQTAGGVGQASLVFAARAERASVSASPVVAAGALLSLSPLSSPTPTPLPRPRPDSVTPPPASLPEGPVRSLPCGEALPEAASTGRPELPGPLRSGGRDGYRKDFVLLRDRRW